MKIIMKLIIILLIIYHFRQHNFQLTYFPQRVDAFTDLLLDVFGAESKHSVYGDFKLWTQDESFNKSNSPAYFIHVIQKPAETGNEGVDE